MTSRPKVFIVEDHADARYLLVLLLEQAGYAVEAVASVEDALERFPTSGSEVLISDVDLPDGNGCDLLRRLHADGWHPYAIAVSGYGAPSDVAESLRAGFRHHLVKPLDAARLERLLGEALAERSGAARTP